MFFFINADSSLQTWRLLQLFEINNTVITLYKAVQSLTNSNMSGKLKCEKSNKLVMFFNWFQYEFETHLLLHLHCPLFLNQIFNWYIYPITLPVHQNLRHWNLYYPVSTIFLRHFQPTRHSWNISSQRCLFTKQVEILPGSVMVGRWIFQKPPLSLHRYILA